MFVGFKGSFRLRFEGGLNRKFHFAFSPNHKLLSLSPSKDKEIHVNMFPGSILMPGIYIYIYIVEIYSVTRKFFKKNKKIIILAPVQIHMITLFLPQNH